jgi:fructose/tagatose bisphosphate aldolase
MEVLSMSKIDMKKYNEALQYRPDTIKKLFPDSKALIVSGKVISEAMLRKEKAGTKCITIAGNGRNPWVLEGVLRAGEKTNSAVIVEIAKSESNYCPVTMKNIATHVDQIINKHNLKVVVAVHADHYTIKQDSDVEEAKVNIPEIIEAGITSVALDASHLEPHDNVFANIALGKLMPEWVALETEVGEIKGEDGLSSVEDAVFHTAALNAYGIFPTWIALNNGSVHGLEATGAGINVELTAEIHEAIRKYGVFGAQHGTSGNNYDKLKNIAGKTNTTKANVATALQMVAWGLKVNEFGNAEVDANGEFIKLENEGVTQEAWDKMVAIAKDKGWNGGNYKKLNLEVQELLEKLPENIQARMVSGVEKFVVNLLDKIILIERYWFLLHLEPLHASLRYSP